MKYSIQDLCKLKPRISKGKWLYVGNRIIAGETTIATVSLCDPHSDYAKTGKYPSNKCEVEANTVLMSAAPIMLKALQIAYMSIPVEDIKAADTVKAAILRATGQIE